MATGTQAVARAKYLWSQSPRGRMLERMLPPSVDPGQLPESRSEAAELSARYVSVRHPVGRARGPIGGQSHAGRRRGVPRARTNGACPHCHEALRLIEANVALARLREGRLTGAAVLVP